MNAGVTAPFRGRLRAVPAGCRPPVSWAALATGSLLAWLALQPNLAAARGYQTSGLCGPYARAPIASPLGTCVGLVADENEGLRAPRRLLEVSPGRFWLIDMGSWEKNQGRLLEMNLPAAGEAPRRAQIRVLARGLDRPQGLAIGPDGKAYIAEAGRIWRTPLPKTVPPAPAERTSAALTAQTKVPTDSEALPREVVLDGLPADGAHPLKAIAFGPDGRLYVNMGSATDACRDARGRLPKPCPELQGEQPRAAVYVARFEGAERRLASFKPFATGLRNSLALAVVPDGRAQGTVLQAENNIDYSDVNSPPEELNRLSQGSFHGWPYCVADQAARGYEGRFACAATAPLMTLPAHAAPLDMLVTPESSRFLGQTLMAWHGHREQGHRVVGYVRGANGLPSGDPIEWLGNWRAQPPQRPLGKPAGLALDHLDRLWIVEDYNRTVLVLLSESTDGAPPDPVEPKASAPHGAAHAHPVASAAR